MHRHAGLKIIILNMALWSQKKSILFYQLTYSFLSVGQYSKIYICMHLIEGFLIQWCSWLARNRMICSSGRQFELLIEWKGYVHWAQSIVSLSLRCVEAVMKSSWTRSKRNCDRSSGGRLFGSTGRTTHTHSHVTHAPRDSNKQLIQKSKWSCHSDVGSQITSFSFKVSSGQSFYWYWKNIKNLPLRFCFFIFSFPVIYFLAVLWHEVRNAIWDTSSWRHNFSLWTIKAAVFLAFRALLSCYQAAVSL